MKEKQKLITLNEKAWWSILLGILKYRGNLMWSMYRSEKQMHNEHKLITQDEKAWWQILLEISKLQGNLMQCFHVKVNRIWTRFPKETEVTNQETVSRVVFILFFLICWHCTCWEITSRHTQALWFTIHVSHCEVPRQSGGSTQIPSLTGYEPKAIENEAIEPEDLEPRQESLDRSVTKSWKICEK